MFKLPSIPIEEIVYTEEAGCYVATWKGRSIGRLAAVVNGDGSVLLSDVVVREAVQIRTARLDRFLRKISPNWGLARPRGVGIGTELLTRFLDWCRKENVREVFGNVTETDLQKCPFLPDWYLQHGFSLGPADGRAEFFPVKFKVIWHPL